MQHWTCNHGTHHIEDNHPLRALGKPFALEITLDRACVRQGTEASLLSVTSQEGDVLLGASLTQGALKVFWITDANPCCLELACPQIASAGGPDVHLLLEYLGYRAALYVDGTLVDEEWPMGDISWAAAESVTVGDAGMAVLCATFCSGADALGLAPTDGQSTGAADLAHVQYWKPEGHNTGVGDCMPFYHAGRFHLFYLFDRRGHASKWGKGAHQWAHISSTDLMHWESHPLAIPITEEWEGSICTGSVIHHGDGYHAFYAVRAMDGSPAKLTEAISQDGVHFTKTQAYWTLTEPYHTESARDPVVLQDDDGFFHMLVTTSDMRLPTRQNGCLAHLISNDLATWKQQEPFLTPGYSAQPECADWFAWNGWHYLVFSNSQFGPRYRMARQPGGPWQRPPCDLIDGYAYMVPKSAPFHDGRRIMAGFVRRPGARYAGRLVLRELVQNADGTLGTRFLPEGLPAAEGADAGPMEVLSGRLEATPGGFTLGAAEGLAAARASTPSRDYRLRAKVSVAAGAAGFGLCVNASADMAQGFEVRFCPETGRVLAGTLDKGLNAANHTLFLDQVENLGNQVCIELVVYEDVVDLCVNGNRTLVAPNPETEHAGLFLFAHWGQVAFSEFNIAPLPGA
ncbi:MAG: glycosyl hydrolase [Anaerolineae bacterium]